MALFVRVKAGVSGAIVGGVHRGPGQVVARVEALLRAVAILGTGDHMEIVDEATGALVPWPPGRVELSEVDPNEHLGRAIEEAKERLFPDPEGGAELDHGEPSVKADFDTPATVSTVAAPESDPTSAARRGRRGR